MGGETFKLVLKNLNKGNKYTIYHKVLNAKDYEVPQKRERIFIIGIRNDITTEFVYPTERKKKLVLKDVLTDCPESVGASYPDQKKKIMDLVPPGGCWIDLPKKIQKSYMGASYYSGGGKRGMARRLSMNEPSLTLTTSPCQKQTERCHPLETRPLNLKEYARIQTFDDDYYFSGSMNQIYKQIGNAVPVRLAYFVAKSIKKLLSNQKVDSKKNVIDI